uniref:UBA domain containing 2 n=2 Tax=Myotis myotis TaxID=51298 RepID=A0A7J7Z9Z5_MYOMY|nr:UBA domain containing 2 [Myotis myotis]
MFSSTGSSGLYKAPLSKSLLLVPSALSLLLTLLLPHCQRFFLYDLQAVKDDFQIWRLICGRIICLDLKDSFCSSLLIYNFRIFERRYGSRKFASFLLGSWVLSALVDFILVEAMWYSFGITASRNLPSGFLAPVFALFVPFYCSIPRVQVAHILGPLSITNKTLIYILGLQLFTSGSYIWIVAISGLISGICYNSKILQVHQVLYIPSWMAKFCSWTLEPIFSSSEPTTEARVGMGATVDIQRQQRMELLDRQLMLSQFAQARRQRQQQLALSPPLTMKRRNDPKCTAPIKKQEKRVAEFALSLNSTSDDEPPSSINHAAKVSTTGFCGSDSETEGKQLSSDEAFKADPLVEGTSSRYSMYNSVSQKLMAKMGFREGEGLGKYGQGRKDIVEASNQKGRRGLGLTLQGFEQELNVDWRDEPEPSAFEQVSWFPECTTEIPDTEEMSD